MQVPQNSNINQINAADFDFKKQFFKYLYYWKFFLGTTVFFLLIAFTYLRYTTKVYDVTAKIKIIDKKNR